MALSLNNAYGLRYNSLRLSEDLRVHSIRETVAKIKSNAATLISIVALVIGGSGAVLAFAPAASANGRPSTNPTACAGGQIVVNVTYTLTNDLDSAVGGSNWANDTLNRHLQVFDMGSGQFCGVLSDNGSFVTLGTVDPATGTAGSLAAGIRGVINGGYNTGNYSSSFTNANYNTQGNLGTFDANGPHPSIFSYTPEWPYSQPFWGWEYKTAQNGTWINAQAGNTGNISN
jgi:hypothetical protein